MVHLGAKNRVLLRAQTGKIPGIAENLLQAGGLGNVSRSILR